MRCVFLSDFSYTIIWYRPKYCSVIQCMGPVFTQFGCVGFSSLRSLKSFNNFIAFFSYLNFFFIIIIILSFLLCLFVCFFLFFLFHSFLNYTQKARSQWGRHCNIIHAVSCSHFKSTGLSFTNTNFINPLQQLEWEPNRFCRFSIPVQMQRSPKIHLEFKAGLLQREEIWRTWRNPLEAQHKVNKEFYPNVMESPGKESMITAARLSALAPHTNTHLQCIS